jgi:hypothetical protein
MRKEPVARETDFHVRQELKSPRSAAIAGILFSLIMTTIMLLTTRMARVEPEEIYGSLLERWSGTVSLILFLTPFAGISFLWFTGVIRDWLGANEDRFFATIFLGSGVIFVLLVFVWSAVFGAMMSVSALLDDDLYIFGFALMNQIIGNYALRMAGVFMLSIASLWHRTGHAARWLVIITYVFALGFLVAGNQVREARFIFPAWVFLVSLRILTLTYRGERVEPSDAFPGS